MDVTDELFETEVLERSVTTPVVVDLWAEWCGPCRTLGPILEKVVGETGGDVDLVKVDVDNNPQISTAFLVPAPSEADQLVAKGDEDSLRRALELEPGHPGAVVALAEQLVQRGENEEALA